MKDIEISTERVYETIRSYVKGGSLKLEDDKKIQILKQNKHVENLIVHNIDYVVQQGGVLEITFISYNYVED